MMTDKRSALPAFVLVDDDEDDRLLMRMALRDTNSQFPIVELENGAELIEYLEQDLAHYNDGQIHWLVIMDINMPILNGPDALRQMQQHHLWKAVPVMMMSTSDEPEIQQEMLSLGAIAYVVKPKSYVGLINKIKTTFEPWMQQHVEANEQVHTNK